MCNLLSTNLPKPYADDDDIRTIRYYVGNGSETTWEKAVALHLETGKPLFAVVYRETDEWEGGWRDVHGPYATGCWEGGEQVLRVQTYAWEECDGEWNWSEDCVSQEAMLEGEL